MKQFTFTITDALGIHARPAGALVKKAQEFESSIALDVNGRHADAKSILGVMGLGAAQNDALSVQVEGSDEEQAAAGIRSFLEQQL